VLDASTKPAKFVKPSCNAAGGPSAGNHLNEFNNVWSLCEKKTKLTKEYLIINLMHA
jgi:hypothetical protein